MLSKNKYPHLNRAARRHPARHARAIAPKLGGATTWLLDGLLIKGGYTPAVNAEGAQV